VGTTVVSPPVVKARALFCPNCGGPVQLRGYAHTLTVVCPQCLSVLDASTPTFQILQTFQSKQRIEPKIPLGTRGKIGGTVYEIIGFQVRDVTVAGDFFSWEEYLLFNPYKGFRYLSGYMGHWNFIRVLNALPQDVGFGRKMQFDGRTYSRFDTVTAETSYVLGEFPWRAQVGDSAEVGDFISPPYMLSSESTGAEITWSLGEYWTGDQIWKTFNLPGRPDPASGVFANQPSPHAGKAKAAWSTWVWLMVALVGLLFWFEVSSAQREVFRQHYTFSPGMRSEPSFVTPIFELTGRTSNVEVHIDTDLTNDWAYFGMALIDDDNGQGFDFGREVSYYNSDGETEGSRNNRVLLPSIPSGRYYLRVEPEMSAGSRGVSYDLVVRRDVPNFSFFWIAALLLLIPPILTTVRTASFESMRWRESDYAPGGGVRTVSSGDSD
jgi:uncharacterized protein DUF4178